MFIMRGLIFGVIAVALIAPFLILESNAIFTPVIPIYSIDNAPTIDEFKKFSQDNLLKDYGPFSITRENGERIDSYYFYDDSKKPKIILYIEDSTDERLENYRPYNSDFITWYFEAEHNKGYFIYAERNGNSCLFPSEKYADFWSGVYSGCDGGAVEVKETDEGFAIYVKFFDDVVSPTIDDPYSLYFDYVDIQESDEDGILKKWKSYHFPDLWTEGKAVPMMEPILYPIQVNSGKISTDDFLYKPIDILTEKLTRNSFSCADDTVSIDTSEKIYSLDDVANVHVSVKSDYDEKNVKLRLYNLELDELYQKQGKISSDGKVSFLIDLDKVDGINELGNQAYKVEAEYGIDGPKDFTYFGIGKTPVPEKPDLCYFYATFDKFSKSASFLIHVEDPSNTGYDQVQIFVDKQGDSIKNLDSNDVSYSIDTTHIGAHEYSSDGGWLTHNAHNGEGRILQSANGYDAFLHVDNVSENFKFAIEQIDHTGYDLKTTQIPNTGFSTMPEFWSDIELHNDKPSVLLADRYQPDEIVVTQLLDINLILIGDTWDPELEKLIKKNLNEKYSPFIHSELNRAGITYHYNFDFVDVSESDSNALFDFVTSESESWGNTFYGKEDFDDPWGFGPWIQANHTEWVNYDRYDVDYKIMDAEKMEDYIQKNIITLNNKFTKPTAVNLVFISGDMDDVDFLHTYGLYKKDQTTQKYHDAVGMMGFGGKYNFYFFDLYAVPWDDWQGWFDYDLTDEYGYDKAWNNNMKNLHDIHTSQEHANLISNYVNNSTSMIITPSYLYGPTYKSNITMDIVLIADGGLSDIPTLTGKYFDETKIKKQLEELAPFTKWNIKFSVFDIQDRELSDSVKKVIQSKETILFSEDFPELGSVGIIDTDKLKKALVEWASTRTSSKFKDFTDVKESSWTIPVAIVIADSKDDVYIGNIGTVGIAPAHPDDPRQPCCSIGITTDYNVWTQESSVTDLVLHEIGHTLSFMHPFMGYDDEGEFKVYDYFEKWYWGVMGYNEPFQGCGTWYGYLVDNDDDGWCGIADTFFTQFDKDNYSRGVTVYLIKAAQTNLYNSMIQLERNGQDLNQLDGSTKKFISEIESLLDESDSKLKGNDLLSDNGAIQTALKAAILSSEFAEKQGVSYVEDTPLLTTLEIPEWIKTNAGWWADDSISQTEFLKTIEFLIKQNILIIPDIAKSGETSSEPVPEWIKNNAGWWADGSIDDEAFVNGIQYLVEQGIIPV